MGDDEQGDEEAVQDAGGGPGRDRAVVHRPPCHPGRSHGEDRQARQQRHVCRLQP